jgi:RNA polymerase sigma-70 factor (ECF subfamily)
MTFSTDSDDTAAMLDRVAAGDSAALEDLLEHHRPYLTRIIEMRLEPSLRTRIDASDVAQEAQILIIKGMDQYIERRPTSFRIWIRRKALDQLKDQRRRHIGTMKRSVLVEQNISDVSSIAIARKLLSNTPSKILGQIELRERIHHLIEQLGDIYREVLELRHAEELTNAEVADLLGIDPNTARQRYGRALLKLHRLFAENGIDVNGAKE